jgi:tRNA pseudouridine38-40 synthase
VEGSLRTLALVLEYDGTGYHGFQRQDELPSIAERVEEALGTLFGRPTKITAAGRTDAGVHATGQVVSCATTSLMPLRRIAVAASALLRPHGIAVVRAVERAAGFSARRDALSRTYRYRILNRVAPSPLYAKRAFHVSAQLDVEAMRAAALALIGEHDFAAFCAVESRARGTIRNVHALEVQRNGDFLDVVITADSFVHNMVRIIVGTLIEVGRGRRTAPSVEAVLKAGERARAGFTAPPHGLYLEKVEFSNRIM